MKSEIDFGENIDNSGEEIMQKTCESHFNFIRYRNEQQFKKRGMQFLLLF